VTLPPRTEDERVTASVLLADSLHAIIQVGDAKNPRRTLLLTLQLAEMGMLASISFTATLIWAGIVVCVLLGVGWLAARLIPGERSPLLIELPPLRVPRLSNVLIKTLAHLEWYVKEAVPLFLLGTFLLWALQAIGVLPWLIGAGEPLVAAWLGLPREASAAFLIGFLRREIAATGLFALQAQGLLTPRQAVVAMVTITLFIPCIASVIMIGKERGARTAGAMVLLIFPLAFAIGGVLQRLLSMIGWGV
jgi:ferrous iron transport protein B